METALYLIPVTLGPTPHDHVFPPYNTEIISQLKYFIVEEERTARRFLKAVNREIDIDSLTFYPMGKHARPELFADYLKVLQSGQSMGVISEAGCPAVADPGADVVYIAQRKGLRVIPLVGPSSILMAVMGSGFNGQSFAFNGYLPIGEHQRATAIKRLEARAYADDQTQLFIETPFRNAQMLHDLIQNCKPQTQICIAAGITCADEYIRTHTVEEWKREPVPDLRKTPAIFLIYHPNKAPKRTHKK